MSAAYPHHPQPAPHDASGEPSLRVSLFEQVSGMLMAVLVLLGFITLLLFIVWLGSRLIWQPQPVQVEVLEDVGGGGSGSAAGTTEQQLDEPSPEELPEVTETKFEDTINTVSELVSSQTEVLESLEGSTSLGQGQGTGTGDGRGPGPGGPGTSDGIPAWERWEVRLNANSLTIYAQQLDFFKVELGVAGGGSPNVDYIANLSSPQPRKRVGKPQDEKRVRFLQKSGPLRDADRELAQKAGVNVQGRVVFQFYPKETYDKLLRLENQQMGKRRIKEVQKTIFGVRGNPGNWDFYVISQTYRAV
jgi:hypothetical protein